MTDNNGAPQGPNQQGPQGPNYQGPQNPNQYGQQRQPQWGPQGPQQGYGQPQMTPQQQARQQKLYEQAQKKANRPIWKKKRFILPVASVLLIGACTGLVVGNGDTQPSAGPAPSSDSSVEAPTADETKKAEGTKKVKEPNKAKEPKKAKEAPSEPELAKIGDTVAAGNWDFTVTKFKCGSTKVGSEYLNKSAQGQFCKMSIKVKNNGKQQETLNDSNQKLFDAEGREFSSDSEASLYEDSDSALFLEGVNPGNTAKGVVIFDVPEDAKILRTELVGGFFGFDDVATVDLSKRS